MFLLYFLWSISHVHVRNACADSGLLNVESTANFPDRAVGKFAKVSVYYSVYCPYSTLVRSWYYILCNEYFQRFSYRQFLRS